MARRSLTKNEGLAGLSRPSNRMIAGVCAAIADRFDVSTFLVRAAFVISIVLPGPQFLVYIALWILIPNRD